MKKLIPLIILMILLGGCFGAKPKVEIRIVKLPRVALTVPEKPVLPKVEMTKEGNKIILTEEAYKNLQIRDTLMKGYVDKLETVIFEENKFIKEYNSQIEKESTAK